MRGNNWQPGHCVATTVVAPPKCRPVSIISDASKIILQDRNVRLNVALRRVILTMAAVGKQ